ncbi:hypothetical protein D3C86_1745690 [compost metagenome]
MGGVDIQVLQFDAAHQGRGENLLGKAAVDLGQAQQGAVVALVDAVENLHQLHHHRQAGEGFLARADVHRLDHGAAETVVKGAAAGCVITTKTNDHG